MRTVVLVKRMATAATCGALGMLGGGCATSMPTSGSAWDAKVSVELQAEPAEVMRKFDAGDVDALLGKLDDAPVVLDLDENDKPVRYEGREQVKRYFDGLRTAMKSQGLAFSTVVEKSQCHATQEVGYCVLDLDQSIRVGDQPAGQKRYRVSIVTRRVDGEWRWTLWHASAS